MANYDQGNVVRCSATFTVNGTPTDPTTVKFACLSPTQAVALHYTYVTNAQLVKDGVGAYHVDVDTTPDSGPFQGRFYATGTGQASASFNFYVNPDTLT